MGPFRVDTFSWETHKKGRVVCTPIEWCFVILGLVIVSGVLVIGVPSGAKVGDVIDVLNAANVTGTFGSVIVSSSDDRYIRFICKFGINMLSECWNKSISHREWETQKGYSCGIPIKWWFDSHDVSSLEIIFRQGIRHFLMRITQNVTAVP